MVPCYYFRIAEDTLFNQSYDIELTYTSNAIEGNTLTAAETRMVIEHGVTIGRKPLKDHLEAIDHFEALRHVRDLAQPEPPSGQTDRLAP